jgi:Domain of unknown function (DUF4332)
MNIDWQQAKKITLWDYDELVSKLLKTLAYGFVLEQYNHTMDEAGRYVKKVQEGYLQGRSEPAIIDQMLSHFKKLENLQVKTYLNLVQQVESREKCERFLERTGFGFNELIETLNYLFRWVLPFMTPVREFIDMSNVTDKAYFEKLKGVKLASNLDLLEKGRKREGRIQLSQASGIPDCFITDLVHQADISRLAYVRGKTVRHLCGGGYNTLDKIANADVGEMEQAMEAYYRTLGKSLADFKAVIPLTWMIGGARILPKVFEV